MGTSFSNPILDIESHQGMVIIKTIVQIIEELNDDGDIKIAIAMPGEKTSNKRGIKIMKNGPRMLNFCKELEAQIPNLVKPIIQIENDSKMCGLGENIHNEGSFRNIKNGYYLGGGTGLAECLKLNDNIFDINENGDILIAAPTNVIGMKWGCYGTEIAGAESEYGNINARDFLRDCIETDNIFYYADTFEINGKNDWYVPSKDEMLKMNSLIVNGNVSGFENSVYLTSSEYNSTNFYRVNPFNISSSYTTKNTTSHFLRLMRKESKKYLLNHYSL